MNRIPVVDIFAGPGGLSEGFSSIHRDGERLFHVRLSIENKEEPFKTLRLRAFFRQFQASAAPDDYYRFLRGEIDQEALFTAWPEQATRAAEETWQATLGECDSTVVDARIAAVVEGCSKWVLIGGPPCQAYSCAGVVGNKTNKCYKPEDDPRYHLYKEYIRVLAVHAPAAFVLENVPGMLSAKINSRRIIDDILLGLTNPSDFAFREFGSWPEGPRYRLLSLTTGIRGLGSDPRAFIVRAQDFGIPQTRHRVIIIGIRDDIDLSKFRSPKTETPTKMNAVLNDLPRVRSMLSREPDSQEAWRSVFDRLNGEEWFGELGQMHGRRLASQILKSAIRLMKSSPDKSGAEFIPCRPSPEWNVSWYVDARLGGVCHHQTRPHIRRDLHRYLFCACFGKVIGRSPKLSDFPPSLLPDHSNSLSGSFKDRFRVLLPDRPAGTIISHLAKDGHAFIHPDPIQCRSLTPREAGRLQTFPDNYFFFGGRTSRFHQIGNAVPPLLARVIAKVLLDLLNP
jgi:DNA (cytosine-5)-methyltransferase 1